MVFHETLYMNFTITQPIVAALWNFFSMFPGVPIFFVISGYLITKSYDSRPGDLKRYVRNRVLRIYPAMWVAWAVSLTIILALGGIRVTQMLSPRFFVWVVQQLAFPVSYVPPFLRAYGNGNPNASLWTIPLELQYYVCVPIVYLICVRLSKVRQNLVIGVFALISFGFYYRFDQDHSHLGKFVQATFIEQIWLFLVGMLIHRNWDRLRPYMEGKGLIWVAAYAIPQWFLAASSNFVLQRIWMVVLGFAVISLAYSAKTLASKVLRGVDISYGVYLYHMIVMNAVIQLGFREPGWPIVAIVLALFSWFLVEKPAMKRKAVSIHPVTAEAAPVSV